MSDRVYSAANLIPENDPCTFAYQRSRAGQATSARSTKDIGRQGYRLKIRKAKLAFVRAMKRLLGIKPKKSSSFVLPHEYKQLNRSPMRSRSSSTRMTIKSVPTPAVYLTTPSIRRGLSNYQVHSYPGVGTPPTVERNTVRFSHPVVSGSVLSAGQSTPVLLSIPEYRDKDEDRSNRSSVGTEDSMESSFLSSQNDNDPPPVRPKSIWRWSAQSVTADGSRESFSDFKNRLDGHMPRSDRQNDRPPSLQFIPRVGTIKLPGSEPPATKSSVQAAEAIEKHRSDALSSLEGLPLQATRDCYVLAIVPRKDLPTTAVQISSDQYPSSLIPGGLTQPRPGMTRPHTFAATSTDHIYQPYSPSASPPTELSQKKQGKVAIKEPFELPSFDNLAGPYFNARHSQNCKKVESGVLDPSSVTQVHVSAQTSRSASKSGPALDPKSSFLLTPSPPSSDEERHTPLKQANRKTVIMGRPSVVTIPAARSSKPLPETPDATTFKTSNPVSPIEMNANGFPTIMPHPSKRFSANAKYQRRSVDPVEAKYLRDHPNKAKKSTKGSKSDSGQSNKLKKSVSELEKKRLAELNVMDIQLRKLMI